MFGERSSGWQEVDIYRGPRYYDLIFDADSKLEAKFLRDLYRRYRGGETGRLLEPACGTGRLVKRLTEMGFRVDGFDQSDAMLSFAERKCRSLSPPPRLFRGGLADFTTRAKYDMAFCLVSTFKYLLTEREAERHLRLIADRLRDGGLYVLGFHLTDYDRTSCEHERYVASRNGLEVTCNIRGWPPERNRRRERVRSRLLVRRRGSEQRRETNWWFRTYSERQFARLLRKIPSLRMIARYGFDYDLEHPFESSDGRNDLVAVLRKS